MGCGVLIRCPLCFGFDIALQDKKFMQDYYEDLDNEIVVRYKCYMLDFIKEKKKECYSEIKQFLSDAEARSIDIRCFIAAQLFTYLVQNKWFILQSSPRHRELAKVISNKLKEFYKDPKKLDQGNLQSWHLELFGGDIRCGCQLKFEPENTLLQ
jgi:hypothetical protein